MDEVFLPLSVVDGNIGHVAIERSGLELIENGNASAFTTHKLRSLGLSEGQAGMHLAGPQLQLTKFTLTKGPKSIIPELKGSISCLGINCHQLERMRLQSLWHSGIC